mgnify:CR=1 FL=1
MRSADHLIDLGPGAGADGGRVIAHGSPSDVAENTESVTGRSVPRDEAEAAACAAAIRSALAAQGSLAIGIAV